MSESRTDLQVARKLTQKASNAATRGIAFNMSFKRMKQLCNQKTCFFTGIPFVGLAPLEKADKLQPGPVHPHAMTLDRVDNSKGYTDENVVACTFEINTLKANMSLQMIKQLFNGINRVTTRNTKKAKPRAKLVVLQQRQSA